MAGYFWPRPDGLRSSGKGLVKVLGRVWGLVRV